MYIRLGFIIQVLYVFIYICLSFQIDVLNLQVYFQFYQVLLVSPGIFASCIILLYCLCIKVYGYYIFRDYCYSVSLLISFHVITFGLEFSYKYRHFCFLFFFFLSSSSFFKIKFICLFSKLSS